MQDNGTTPIKRVWAQDVNVAVDVLHARLGAAKVAKVSEDEWTEADEQLAAGVCARLRAARDATLRRTPSPGRLSNWWRGTLIEAAYQNLHAAESLMVFFYGPDEVDAEIPEAVARVEAGLDRDDPRRIAALDLLHELNTSSEAHDKEVPPRVLASRVARLAKAMEVGFGASDAEHGRLRNFRNTVFAGAVVLALVTAVFAVFLWYNPTDVPFCFEPKAPNQVCASGGTAASPHDIVTVILMGTLGGLVAAISAITTMRGTPTPYEVPKALALLKLPLGAVTAIGGLLAIRGDFVPGFSQLDSQPQILAYAFAFGFAQQLLTRLVDRRAQTLLERSPGKASKVAREKRSAERTSLRTRPETARS
jgi:hypothetical protein